MKSNKRKTHEEFAKELAKRNDHYSEIELLDSYSGALKRIKCKCKRCGNIWDPIASSLMQGTGCPLCAKKRIAEVNSKILKEYRVLNPPANKISNGEFLNMFKEKSPYADTITILSKYSGMREKIDCLCSRCGKKWRTLPAQLLNGQGCPNCRHSSTSFMEQFIVRTLIYVLGEGEVIQRDRKAIGRELDIYLPKYALAIEIGSWKWHKKTYEQDLEKIDICKKNGIRLLTFYDNCKEPVSISNKDVSFFPGDLRQEDGNKTLVELCVHILKLLGEYRKLNDNEWGKISHDAYLYSQRRTNKEFIDDFMRKNPHASEIRILSEYKDAHTAVECECAACGNKWKTAAGELIRGSGCPKCEIKKVGIAHQKKKEVLDWRRSNPNGNKKQCSKETGISYVTVLKWWDET